ncbi:MAG: hypothetical protein ACT4NV_02810 [Rhodoferax sp.]
MHLSPSYTTGRYASSEDRSYLIERGLSLSAEYGTTGGISLGWNNAYVAFHSGAYTDQYSNSLSGHYNFAIPSAPGRWSARLDLHGIHNNDASGDTDKVRALAPQVSWASTDGQLYADLGYARTLYQNDLSATQYTPTFGFALNDSYDWVQLRGYFISGLSPARAAGKSSTTATEIKWTHYTSGSDFALMPASFSVGLLGGERLYAVDMDSQSVSNLADIHTGTANLGMVWKLGKQANLFVLVGQARFRKVSTDNNYMLNVGHATFTMDF